MSTSLKTIYSVIAPSDPCASEINPHATLGGLLDCIINDNEVYEYIGIHDSIIRERLFNCLSDVCSQIGKNIYDCPTMSPSEYLTF